MLINRSLSRSCFFLALIYCRAVTPRAEELNLFSITSSWKEILPFNSCLCCILNRNRYQMLVLIYRKSFTWHCSIIIAMIIYFKKCLSTVFVSIYFCWLHREELKCQSSPKKEQSASFLITSVQSWGQTHLLPESFFFTSEGRTLDLAAVTCGRCGRISASHKKAVENLSLVCGLERD